MKKRLAYILFFITTIIWGFAFVSQKEASVVAPFSVGVGRGLLASVLLFAIIPLMDRLTKNGRCFFNKKNLIDINRRELIGGVVLGVLITVASAFQQYGLGAGTDAGKAAFITALYVVLVPIMSIFIGKKPNITSIISVPIAVVGFYLLCIKPGSSLEVNDLLVLICAVIFAVQIIAVDRLSPGCDGIRMSLIQFVVSSVLNFILAYMFEGGVDYTGLISVFPSIMFLGLLSSGVGYTLQIIGQKAVDPTVSSIILSMESVFGVIGAALLLGEVMTAREYIGCAVVLVAVILAQIELPVLIERIKAKREDKNE